MRLVRTRFKSVSLKAGCSMISASIFRDGSRLTVSESMVILELSNELPTSIAVPSFSSSSASCRLSREVVPSSSMAMVKPGSPGWVPRALRPASNSSSNCTTGVCGREARITLRPLSTVACSSLGRITSTCSPASGSLLRSAPVALWAYSGNGLISRV